MIGYTFRLVFDLGNAAFDENVSVEVARILREIANRIEDEGQVPIMYRTIHDINGNDVGRYAAKRKE